MVFRVLKYEIKRTVPLYSVWAAIGIMLAIIARLKIFSLTDLPLFYLMFFGSIGIILYRYYCTMHGSEATFIFTVNLSSGKQMIVRYISFLIWSLITTLVIGAVLLIQGENMGTMIQNLSFPMSLLLISELLISVFVLVIMICVPLTLANIRPFFERRALSFIILGAAVMGLFSLLSKTTENFITSYLVVTDSGNVFISSIYNTPESISFSFNTLIWNIICTVIYMITLPVVIRKKLLLLR